jgi:hypothetical protein
MMQYNIKMMEMILMSMAEIFNCHGAKTIYAQ